ncbi:hypothetical protein GW17_00055848 [Ensete ventricosum]|nr:hypothetical protein GW17_00055848 [Ensete ventricosum]
MKPGHRDKVQTMQWDLAGSSLGVRRRDWEARWEHAGRSLEEDRKIHRKNARDCQIDGKALEHHSADYVSWRGVLVSLFEDHRPWYPWR